MAADLIVGYIIVDVLNAGIIPHSDIVKGGISHARLLHYAARKSEGAFEIAEPDNSGKSALEHPLRVESVFHPHTAPVIGYA